MFIGTSDNLSDLSSFIIVSDTTQHRYENQYDLRLGQPVNYNSIGPTVFQRKTGIPS